jgi:hypothetical protein
MNPLISPRGRSPRGAFHRLALFAAALGLLATAVAPAADTSAATPTQARLVVDAPSRVAVGQGFRIRLSVRDVDDLAGYEANLRYDAGAVTFRGVSQRRNGIRAVGRDVRALGPVERADGVTFGAYSCATDDCRTRRGVSKRTGRTRALDLATVRLSSARAGRLELRLAATRFVDADGRVLAVDTSAARRIVISVGGGADGIAAPAGRRLARPFRHHAAHRRRHGRWRRHPQRLPGGALGMDPHARGGGLVLRDRRDRCHQRGRRRERLRRCRRCPVGDRRVQRAGHRATDDRPHRWHAHRTGRPRHVDRALDR